MSQPPAFAQPPGAGAAYAQQPQQMPAQQQAPYQPAQQQHAQQQAPAFAQPQQAPPQQAQAQAARPPAAMPQQQQNGAPAVAVPAAAAQPAPQPAASAQPAAATAPTASAGRTLPAFDLFLDLPHPAASEQCPPRVIISPPTSSGNAEEDAANQRIAEELSGDPNALARIARFAFPEFDDQAHGALRLHCVAVYGVAMLFLASA